MPNETRQGFHQADLFLLLTAVLWGINIPVVKFASQNMDALTFNAVRMVLSTLALGICCWVELRISTRGADPSGSRVGGPNALPVQESPVVSSRWGSFLLRVVFFSFLSGLLYPLSFMLGIDRTTAGNTALLLASMPMWTALLSMLFLSEKLNRLTWIGLLVAFAGTALIIAARGNIDLSSQHILGNALMLIAALVWASATVVSAPLLRSVRPLTLAFVSALLTTPIHVWWNWDKIANQWEVWSRGPVLWSVLYSGILSTGIAYATWHVGVRKLGGSHAAVYQNVVTLVAVIVSWTVLAEPILLLQVVGGSVAIVGLLLLRRGRRA